MSRRRLTAPAPPPPLPEPVADGTWMLDPSITFLNHGCFGARLRPVHEAQQAWREAFERRPVEFLDQDRDDLISVAKRGVGEFLGMRPENFGFVTNATEAVNAVVRSLPLTTGDELLTTDHAYNAVRLTLAHRAEQTGASFVEAPLALPVGAPGDVVDAIMAAVTPRTRLLVVDHVTSPTALRLPIGEIIARCATRGVDVLVDGAHAPGMLPLDVEALGAAYYTGNLHKWIGAPPGAAFLWVRPDRQAAIHPVVVSHFLGDGLAAEFSWQGTRDITPWLAAAVAIEEMDRLLGTGSWPRIMARNHELAAWVQTMLAAAWSVEPLSPLDGSMLGSMAAVAVPEPRSGVFAPQALHDRLYREHGIEVPIFEWAGRWLARPCCQVYNTPEEFERFAEAMLAVIR